MKQESMSDYLAHPAVGHSMFETFLTDGAREYEARYVNKTVPPTESSKMDIGTLAHAAILEPDEMDSRYVEIPKEALTSNGQKRGKAWDQFSAENSGKLLLKTHELQAVREMRDAVYSNPFLAGQLSQDDDSGWTPELSCYFRWMGVDCKARFDLLAAMGALDIKTTEVSLSSFERTAANMAYHRKAAWYSCAAQKALGRSVPFYLLAVRQKPPYQARLFVYDEESLDQGADEIIDNLQRLGERIASGDWADEEESRLNTLSLPPYMRRWRQDKDGAPDEHHGYQTDEAFSAALEAAAAKIESGELCQ